MQWPAAIARLAVCLLVAAVIWGPPCASAQPSMQIILTNGPVLNRLNIVVLSEGYTTSQLAQFAVDATNAINALLSHAPYQEYRNYFNAYAIKVASNQSGSSHFGATSDTYFHSSYDTNSDRLITIPPNFFQAEDGIRDTSVTGVQTCALPI